MKIGGGVAGHIKITKNHPTRGDTVSIEFPNIFTTVGLNRLSFYPTNNSIMGISVEEPGYLHVGEGRHSDIGEHITKLSQPVARASVVGSSYSTGTIVPHVDEEFIYVNYTVKAQIPKQGRQWYLKELGLTTDYQAYDHKDIILSTYAEVVDKFGNPFDLLVEDIEILDIEYTYQLRIPRNIPPVLLKLGETEHTLTFIHPSDNYILNSHRYGSSRKIVWWTLATDYDPYSGNIWGTTETRESSSGTTAFFGLDRLNSVPKSYMSDINGDFNIVVKFDPPLIKNNTQELRIQGRVQFTNAPFKQRE